MAKLPKAKTYFEIIAICPDCQSEILVEFIEPYDEQMKEVCPECMNEFTYGSPELVH